MAYRYTLTRDVVARKDDGSEHRIALASVVHENGVGETVAINEDLIKFAGEGIIPIEVERAMKR